MAAQGLSSLLGKLGLARQSAERGSGLGPADAGDTPPGLLYARGFLLASDHVRTPPAVGDWRQVRIPGYTLHVDTRVPVQHAEHDGRSAWLVGDAFEPERGVYRDAARYLLEGDLVERLDGMAGRFALFVLGRGNRLEVYHDAMGSRSIFHGDGIVASHAGLVADVLGTGLREWVIPFITSRGYFQRDVKFLPGLDSPFERVRQLTPNTRLVLPGSTVERYWPRGPIPDTDHDTAVDALVQHMEGLCRYFAEGAGRPVVGVSAGRDSRCALAGLASQAPHLFTFVRSPGGQSEDSPDSKTARKLAEQCELPLEIVRISTPPHLDTAATGFARAFRRNTGYVRGNTSGWVEHFWKKAQAGEQGQRQDVFVRGFGGEVMRGFHKPMASYSPSQLAATYNVNAGSAYTREAFATFCEVAGWTGDLKGHRPEDLFYWEHRMGVWGSSAFSESDMAFRGMPAFNSRRLFEKFIGLPPDVRSATATFDAATRRLFPPFDGIPYAS
jgi:hypothetical protein